MKTEHGMPGSRGIQNGVRRERRAFLRRVFGTGGAAIAASAGDLFAAKAGAAPLYFSVRDHGARGNGTALETAAIQQAIDTCFRAGGGTVIFPAGTYLSGTLILRNHVVLHLESGATLLGSTDLADYPRKVPSFRSYTDVNYVERSLIYAEKVTNIAVTGLGTIHGQGESPAFHTKTGIAGYKSRPYLIRMIECRHVTIRDITLRNSPMWVQHYLACNDLLIDGIRVDSVVNENNDGIDIDGCERVRIANCSIESGDDGIVLKSTSPKPCREITITNCVISSRCNAFKCGTESTGGFLDIAVSNCVIHDTRLSGIALELVDGGVLDGITISNVLMRRTKGGILLRLGDRARPYLARGPGGGQGTHQVEPGYSTPEMGFFRNVRISQVSGDGGDTIGCSISGLPERPIENLIMDDVRLVFDGGGGEEDAGRSIPENPASYPEYTMFGRLPAFGLFCRHVRSLRLRNVQVSCLAHDKRFSLVCEDVSDLEVSGWEANAGGPVPAMVSLRNVRNGWIHGCRAAAGTGIFVHVEGELTDNIRLSANDLSQAAKPVATAANVPPGTVRSGD
jgi:hypothetical protein